MANGFTPELDEQVLATIKRQIREREAEQIAAAKGAATSRGLSGSTFEATRIGLANKSALAAEADALVNLSVENARRQREERLIQESREFETGQSNLSREFSASQSRLQREFQNTQNELARKFQQLENNKQRAFATGQQEAAVAFEREQNELNRQFQENAAREENRNALFQQGIGSLANVGGQLGGLFAAKKLFGNQTGRQGVGVTTVAPQPGGSSNVGLGLLQNKFGASGLNLFGRGGGNVGAGARGSGLGTAGGIAAGFGGGSFLGQKLGNAIFKSRTAEKRARTGATIGAGIGTGIGTLFGPPGSALGGTIGGFIGQGIGGLSKSKPAREISRIFKKIF